MNTPAPYIAPFETAGSGAIGGAAEWLGALATGSLPIALSVIAIAALGLLMFTGRLPIRAGLRTVLIDLR